MEETAKNREPESEEMPYKTWQVAESMAPVVDGGANQQM